jgi:2-C-methyl-D-erythritol 4-phosphate cytidylyltransferase / 2-C-methyl-D-erythritol 2,4-cyclodiphosphate synthase
VVGSAQTESDNGTVAVIVVAAGRGERLPGEVAKPYQTLGGKWILEHAVAPFQASARINEIIVVVAPDRIDAARSRLGSKVRAVVAGGAERRESVAAGLRELGEASWVLVHDGVRPFVSNSLIDRVLDAAQQHGAAVPGVPVTDTLKEADGPRVLQTLDRSRIWAAQTPQAFRCGLLREAHAQASEISVTDDAQLVERIGATVAIVPGDAQNVKITTPEDLAVARRRADGGLDLRVGMGYDVHRLVPDRALLLGGVRIDHPRGLDGHSDADVLTHAIIDAILGAAGNRDIGYHFPPDEPAYRDANSIALLRRTMAMLRADGWAIVNVDASVLAEAPRLSPFVGTMREQLAAALEVGVQSVAVKATTGEGLGPIGRGEGIAAHAIAMIRRVE